MNDPPADTISPDRLVFDQLAEMQARLTTLQEQLRESQRLAAIGTIAAVIAHEFNNLLTPIVSYSQFALQSLDAEKPDLELVRKALTKSFQSSTKAGRICASMLALARGESSQARVPVQELVDQTLLVMARDPQKDGIALRVQVAPNLFVRGDPVQLEQVLLNLLINARQAMSGMRGGSLTIKASADDARDDPATPSADGDAPTGARVRLQVIDTGPGIPPRLLDKIFQPFFTTKGTARKGEAKGTGLGLAICREIVEHHGGRITVESEVGRGTAFTIVLPRCD